MSDTPAGIPPSPVPFKPKKSVALSGITAGNTALCTVGRSGNDLHYRGYDILEFADTAEFEEVAFLLLHERLPTRPELEQYKRSLRVLRVRSDRRGPERRQNQRRCTQWSSQWRQHTGANSRPRSL
jgi:2-methylcitrate synthase